MSECVHVCVRTCVHVCACEWSLAHVCSYDRLPLRMSVCMLLLAFVRGCTRIAATPHTKRFFFFFRFAADLMCRSTLQLYESVTGLKWEYTAAHRVNGCEFAFPFVPVPLSL